jgi:Homeodomain-like domain
LPTLTPVIRAEGVAGLRDRSYRPRRSPAATPTDLVAWIERLRRQRWTAADIAARLRLGRSTVARLLQRRGLARLRALEPPVPVHRYEWPHPGDVLHLDVKKLGRSRGSAIASPAIAASAGAASVGIRPRGDG